MKENNFNNIKEGDKVWSPIYKDGVVYSRTDNSVKISFKYVFESYDISELNNVYNFVKDELYWQKPDWWKDNSYPMRQKWRAIPDTMYFYITKRGEVTYQRDVCDSEDNLLYSIGNYFKDREQAMNSRIYKAFHEEDK